MTGNLIKEIEKEEGLIMQSSIRKLPNSIKLNVKQRKDTFRIQMIFFLEHAGELRIFVLRRREWPIYITDHPPWARMGDG